MSDMSIRDDWPMELPPMPILTNFVDNTGETLNPSGVLDPKFRLNHIVDTLEPRLRHSYAGGKGLISRIVANESDGEIRVKTCTNKCAYTIHYPRDFLSKDKEGQRKEVKKMVPLIVKAVTESCPSL